VQRIYACVNVLVRTGLLPLRRTDGAVGTRPRSASWDCGSEILSPVQSGLPKLACRISPDCVNRQTERPHLVFRHGLTYLFTISHISTSRSPGIGPTLWTSSTTSTSPAN